MAMMRMGRREVLVAGLALSVGLALRIWFIIHGPKVTGDSLVYGDIAKNLLHHGVYGFTKGLGARPTLLRLPGYPLFLTVCFRPLRRRSLRATHVRTGPCSISGAAS